MGARGKKRERESSSSSERESSPDDRKPKKSKKRKREKEKDKDKHKERERERESSSKKSKKGLKRKRSRSSSRESSESDSDQSVQSEKDKKSKQKEVKGKSKGNKDYESKKHKSRKVVSEEETEDSSSSSSESEHEIRKKKKKKTKRPKPEKHEQDQESGVMQISTKQFQDMMKMLQTSNERLASLEKQTAEAPPRHTPDMTPKSGNLPPQKLFHTPTLHGSSGHSAMTIGMGMGMTPLTPSTPGASSKISDVESLDSVETSSTITPEFSKLKLGKGRGRPRKQLVQPTIDDFPNDGTEEEKSKYIRKKTTEMWRFKKLTSSDSAEYRAKENARVKEYLRNRKTKNGKQGEESSASNEDESERKKELDRASSHSQPLNRPTRSGSRTQNKPKGDARGKLGGIKLPGVEKAVRGRGGRRGTTRGRGGARIRKTSPANSTTSTTETIDEIEPLGTPPQIDEGDTPPPPLRGKQTAKRGKPFGNTSRQPLGLKKCSVNIQKQDAENVKPKGKIAKPTTAKSPVGKQNVKKLNKKEGPKKVTKDKDKKEIEQKPGVPDVIEEEKKEEKSEKKKEEGKPEIPKNDTQNKDSKNEKQKKQETVPDKPKNESKGKKTFHMETAMVMDGDSVEDIRKDSMEVIGDSIKIKKLEDQIEGMLTTRTQVKDTQKRIQVLESILRSLQKEALADDEKDKQEQKYVKSPEEKDPKDEEGENPKLEKVDDSSKNNTNGNKEDEKKDTDKEEDKPEIPEIPIIEEDMPKIPEIADEVEEEKKDEEKDGMQTNQGENEDHKVGNGLVNKESKKDDEVRKSVRFDLEEKEIDMKDGIIQVQVDNAITKLALVLDSPGKLSGKIDDAYIQFPSSQKDMVKYMPQTEDISEDEAEDEKIRKMEPKQEEVPEEGSKEENVNENDREPIDSEKEIIDSGENTVEGEEIRKNETTPDANILDSELEKQNEENKVEDTKEDKSGFEQDDTKEEEKQKEDEKEEIKDEVKNEEDKAEEKTSENKQPVEDMKQDVTKDTPIYEKEDEKDADSKEDPKIEVAEETKNKDYLEEKANKDEKKIDVKTKNDEKDKPTMVESGSDFEENLLEKWRDLQQGEKLKSGHIVGGYYLVRTGGKMYPGCVKGENLKKNDDGTYDFEVGFDLFVQTGRSGTYKPMDEWWMVDNIDILKRIEDPAIEKVTSNRVKYHFKLD